MRWRIAVLVSAAIALSYLDRQTLPVAVNAIGKDIPLSNQQFSTLQSAFLLSYAFMYAGGGKLTDALGTRRGFTVIMIFWSLACMSHALALSFAMLTVSRFLLGMGEGGAFPAATKIVADWFPAEERASAMGIINAGTAVGAVIAPPLIAVILSFLNWRWIFVISGALGLLWTAWWWSYFSSEQPAETIPSGHAEFEAKVRWIDLLRIREVWGMVTAKFLSDAAWYFYLFWLPKYLYDARGFDIKAIGAFAWIPYAAAGSGMPVRRMVFQLPRSARVLAERCQKIGAGVECRGDAAGCPCSLRRRVLGHRSIQRGVFRPAILVDPGHGAPRRSSAATCGGIGGGTGWVWWSDGWNCIWAVGGLSARSRDRLSRRARLGRDASCDCLHCHFVDDPAIQARGD